MRVAVHIVTVELVEVLLFVVFVVREVIARTEFEVLAQRFGVVEFARQTITFGRTVHELAVGQFRLGRIGAEVTVVLQGIVFVAACVITSVEIKVKGAPSLLEDVGVVGIDAHRVIVIRAQSAPALRRNGLLLHGIGEVFFQETSRKVVARVGEFLIGRGEVAVATIAHVVAITCVHIDAVERVNVVGDGGFGISTHAVGFRHAVSVGEERLTTAEEGLVATGANAGLVVV